MMPIPADIGLAEPAKQEVVQHLKKVTADEYILYTKLLKFHWNVRGPFFDGLHTLFEKQYREAAENLDKFAERIRALGHLSLGTAAEFLELTRLKEAPGENPSDMEMIAELMHDHETIIKHLYNDIKKIDQLGDPITSNMLQDLGREHGKSAWMLRAHLETVEKAAAPRVEKKAPAQEVSKLAKAAAEPAMKTEAEPMK